MTCERMTHRGLALVFLLLQFKAVTFDLYVRVESPVPSFGRPLRDPLTTFPPLWLCMQIANPLVHQRFWVKHQMHAMAPIRGTALLSQYRTSFKYGRFSALVPTACRRNARLAALLQYSTVLYSVVLLPTHAGPQPCARYTTNKPCIVLVYSTVSIFS